jgi:hypothetical protein
MPARLPFARRAPAAIPPAERPPASVPSAPAQVSSLGHAARWTVGPGSQDDEWLHRNRRHHCARTDGPTTLTRPAIRAAPIDAAGTSSPVTAPGRGPATRDFSAIPAHRNAPSAHLERALESVRGATRPQVVIGRPARRVTHL